MFHRERDASKVALVGLVSMLAEADFELLDVQWQTDHLASLGVVELPRPAYLERVAHAAALPQAWPRTALLRDH
jgi:leucyl/phenylalanyl-tRNA--protein transferase